MASLANGDIRGKENQHKRKKNAVLLGAKKKSPRQSKPPEFYQREDLTDEITGEIEIIHDDQRGLDQPDVDGARAKKTSEFDKLGGQAWQKYLSKAGWLAKRPGAGLNDPYILYIGPYPVSKTILETEYVEGVTKFTGYEGLGQQYKKDGNSVLKICRRAQKAIVDTMEARRVKDLEEQKSKSSAPDLVQRQQQNASTEGTSEPPPVADMPPPPIGSGSILDRVAFLELHIRGQVSTTRMALKMRVSELEKEMFDEEKKDGGLLRRVEEMENQFS